MAQLIFKNGPLSGQVVDLKSGPNRLGRNPANDIAILDPTISGFHCEFQVAPLSVAIKDAGSRNGTFLDGHRIEREVVTSTRELRVGAIEFTLAFEEVKVAIPEREKKPELFAVFLDDGSIACKNHADTPATQRCLKCETCWCDQCVRKTGLAGSTRMIVSCVDCGGACEKIEIAGPRKAKSIFERVTDTLRFIKR